MATYLQNIKIISCFLLLSSLLLVGCVKRLETQGYSTETLDLSKLHVGKTHKNRVSGIMGTPSASSIFGDKLDRERWYYISNKTERIAFLEPDIVEQQIIELVFDEQQILSAMHIYDANDARDIKAVSDRTPTEGKDLSVFEQLLGNIGRFNNQVEEK